MTVNSRMQTLPRAPRKRQPQEADPIELRALQLYDKYNPDQDRVINVSKAECIKIARIELKRKA